MQQEADRLRCFSRRALVVGGAQVALFGSLAARLYYLQVEKSDEFRLLAEDNRVNQQLIIPPRGRIFDRRGKVVANNVPTYRVRVVREQAGDVRKVLESLARIVPVTPQRIEEIVQAARLLRPFMPISIREDLTWDEVSRIAVHSPDLPGIILDSGLLREYPHGDVLAHILGYVGPVNRPEQERETDPLLQLPDFRIGKSGIERAYDRELRGRSGLSQVEVNAVGREIRELSRRDGEPGADLRLSLDVELQRYCCERLAQEIAASAVVLDVHTGAVLAMASVPSYDPSSFTNGLSARIWKQLRDDPRHPLVNKCIRGQYPPGSTFKMVTALAALETGAVTHTGEVFCPGFMSLGNSRFHCWKEHGHGRVGLVQALEQSCDVYFYELARRVGVDVIATTAKRLGLGEALGIDLPGERPGLIPTRAWKQEVLRQPWQKGETLVCGIGQGFVSVTPLQLATMVARLANGGRAVRPWFVRGDSAHVVTARGESVPSIGMKPENLEWVLKGMRDVVHGARGTARSSALGLPGVEMAGKTGTSQVRRISKAERAVGAHKRKDIPWEERDHALFVCFAPFAKPRYAISVVVEHGEHGSTAAAPVARDIMRKTLELDPSSDEPATLRLARGEGA